MSKRVDGRQSFRRKHGHPLKRKQPMIKQSVTNESLVDEREQQPMVAEVREVVSWLNVT
ncbi:hypothetical protein GGI26_004169 [Coemansia sp. RSA 1358]|nr:hypothetical protein GGI26_004169 [Coemansia sp. RSA 1358]